MDLWVFKDRGSFLHLDQLLSNYRLGVDTYYSYGLLPVWIQHFLFKIFGSGYGPLLGCTVVTIVLMAVFWASLLKHLPSGKLWILVVVMLCPIVIWVNPNFPYSLVQLSMLFSLLLIPEKQYAWAFSVSMIGCLSVPSLPLVLSGFVGLLIVVSWWTESDRKFGSLVRTLLPGILTYASGALLLSWFFSFASFSASALPFLGMQFYKAVHYGTITALMEFLRPSGQGLKYLLMYYAATPVLWWVLATLALFYFGLLAAKEILTQKRVSPKNAVVLICAVLQAIFAFHGYGVPGQEIVYSPWLLAAVLVGASQIAEARIRNAFVLLIAVIGLFGSAAQARRTLLDWKTSVRTAETVNLYAHADWAKEWTKILQRSREHKLFLLSYGTGQHHYFPTLESPEVWFVRTGQMFAADRERVLNQTRNAEIVVEDLNGATSAIDYDSDVQRILNGFCLTEITPNFQIWVSNSIAGAGQTCLSNPRVKH